MSQVVETPVINPRDGFVAGYGDTGITVRVSCADIRATIRYTDDGTEPTTSSAVFPEMGRAYIPMVHPIVIKAKAFRQGFQDSRTAVAHLYVKARPPKFEPLPSSAPIVLPAREGLSVSVGADKLVPGETILVAATTDGSEPRKEVAVAFAKPLLLTQNTTVKAKCFAQGCYDSETVVRSFTFKPFAPVINDPSSSSSFQRSLIVNINCATPGATIQYTLDGSDPITSPTRIIYRGAFTLTATTTVKARTTKANMNMSDQANRTFQRI